MSADTTLPVDLHNGQPDHSGKHNDVNAQVNYLTAQLAGRLSPATIAATISARFAGTQATAGTRALVRKLRAGVDSARVGILGDSSANEPGEWFQTLMVWLLAMFPTYTVLNRVWNDATQKYDAATTLQTGVGGPRNLYCTQSNGGYISTPDSAGNSVTGDLEVQLKIAVDDWTPGTAIDLCGKAGPNPQAGWFIRLGTDGKISLFWSSTGSNALSATSSAATGFADGAIGYIKVALDVDNGAAGCDVKFYTSADAVTWTQLGTTVTQAFVTSIYDNTATLNFPGRSASGPGGISFGGVAAYWMRVYSGIAGTLVADCNAAGLINSATGFTDDQGNTWTPASGAVGASGDLRGAPIVTLYNGSTPGKAIDYSNDATRFAKQTPQPWMDAEFINYGHNDGTLTAYRAPYKQLADAVLAKYPDCAIIAVPQNPQTAPRTTAQITAHASRAATIRSLAASQRYAILDAYDLTVQLAAAGSIATYVNPADGVHPLQPLEDAIAAAGQPLFPVG